ncbi:nucleoside triphosphate pyrophosphohydrolase [Metabacillus idriensis]|uniref:nucleoside triphosphate pyrophosphohydrolase n=1 Tax=Metabacillus idriensis TaxID=324768 RepID=UPI00174A35E6|nr:nucleoside triphosphate pyrophosphohydrolase [Metabacillus idriensis]
MPTYNKLVRDRIPEVIERTGKSFQTTILSQEEYIKELKKKSYEELEEYMEAENNEEALEELADLLEILHAFAAVHGSSLDKVEEIRKKKAEKRGGFQERIFLVDVED